MLLYLKSFYRSFSFQDLKAVASPVLQIGRKGIYNVLEKEKMVGLIVWL